MTAKTKRVFNNRIRAMMKASAVAHDLPNLCILKHYLFATHRCMMMLAHVSNHNRSINIRARIIQDYMYQSKATGKKIDDTT